VTDSLPLATRIWFAWICFFRVLFDGEFAARAFRARDPNDVDPEEPERPEPAVDEAALARGGALQLLGLLQREGRLVDFIQQDIATFDDAAVAAAARVVHDGCRRAVGSHADIQPVRSEEEGTSITLENVDADAIKLTGNVSGSAPYSGTLRHRGWRAADLSLPRAMEGHDLTILAPAEVEL
jgi:hypothetical protein